MRFSKTQLKGENGSFKETLEATIAAIQGGNSYLREDVIGAYQPFIKKAISKVCKQFIDETRDEFSVGLLAFNEAIDTYRPNEGSQFLSFAELVIRRRVIDYIRKEVRETRHIQLDDARSEDENKGLTYIQQKAALEAFSNEREAEDRAIEIQRYQGMLKDFDISFEDLSKKSPKHEDARENAKHIARLLAQDHGLRHAFLKSKQLPTKELLNLVACSRKTIERHRKYIIAISLIYIGDFTSLISYIEPNKVSDL